MPDALSDDQLNTIAEKLADELVVKRRAQWVDPETHYHHHQWVGGKLEKEQTRRELVNKILISSSIWAVPLILTWIALTFWEAIVQAIRAGIQ